MRAEIRPANDETGNIAETAAGIDVRTAGLRVGRAELGEDIGAQKRVQRTERPQKNDDSGFVQTRGNRARRAQDARADHLAHADGDAEGSAEQTEQMTALSRRSHMSFRRMACQPIENSHAWRGARVRRST